MTEDHQSERTRLTAVDAAARTERRRGPRGSARDGVTAALEDAGPEKTPLREDWESVVIRRVARRVAAVREAAGDHLEERFGWEGEGLRRLSEELERTSVESGA